MCTFQKLNNLFLYILTHSSQPPGLTKSLVFGHLLMYYLQNTLVSGFSNITHLLFSILIAHVYQNTDLQTLFLEAMTWLENHYDPMIDRKIPTEMDTSPNDVHLFFNIPRHFSLKYSQHL